MTEHDPDRDVNAWLQSIDDVPPSTRLQRVVAEIPLRHPRVEAVQTWWPFASAFRTMLAAALVCALGVAAGASTLDDATATDVTDATTTDDHGADLAFALSLDEDLDQETRP